jgi:hypothetical protein
VGLWGGIGRDAGVIIRSTHQRNLPWWGAGFGLVTVCQLPRIWRFTKFAKIVLIPNYVVLRAEQKIRPKIASLERSVLRVCRAEQISRFRSAG